MGNVEMKPLEKLNLIQRLLQKVHSICIQVGKIQKQISNIIIKM